MASAVRYKSRNDSPEVPLILGFANSVVAVFTTQTSASAWSGRVIIAVNVPLSIRAQQGYDKLPMIVWSSTAGAAIDLAWSQGQITVNFH